jgi:hypothetical protein
LLDGIFLATQTYLGDLTGTLKYVFALEYLRKVRLDSVNLKENPAFIVSTKDNDCVHLILNTFQY